MGNDVGITRRFNRNRLQRRCVKFVLLSKQGDAPKPIGFVAGGPVKRVVRAPSEAWCILQGESPCRARANHLPVLSVAPTAEPKFVLLKANFQR